MSFLQLGEVYTALIGFAEEGCKMLSLPPLENTLESLKVEWLSEFGESLVIRFLKYLWEKSGQKGKEEKLKDKNIAAAYKSVQEEMQRICVGKSQLDQALGNIFVDLLDPDREKKPMTVSGTSDKRIQDWDIVCISEVLEGTLRGMDVDSFLQANSPYYTAISSQNLKRQICDAIKKVVTEYIMQKKCTTDDDRDFLVQRIVWSVGLQMEGAEKRIVEKLVERMCLQGGPDISLEKVKNSPIVARYKLKECPTCKYCGPRLYVNEETNTVTCPACGAAHQILECVYPEITHTIENNSQNIIAEIKESASKLEELQKQLNQIGKIAADTNMLKEMLGDFSNSIGKYLENDSVVSQMEMKNLQKKIDDLRSLRNLPDEWAKNREALQEQMQNMSLNTHEELSRLQDTIKELLSVAVTKEYLSSVVNTHNSLIEVTAKDINKKLDAYQKEILDCMKDMTGKKIPEIMAGLVEKQQSMNEVTVCQLESLGNDLKNLDEYVRENLKEMHDDHETLRELLKSMCIKEYLEDFRSSLGTDLGEAVALLKKNNKDLTKERAEIRSLKKEIQALSVNQISQILSTLNVIYNKANKNPDELKKLMRQTLTNVSGQLLTMQELIEKGNQYLGNKMLQYHSQNQRDHMETKELLLEINRKLDEKILFQFGEALVMDASALSSLKDVYRGRIPSRYMVDDGYGEPFECLYCGVSEPRVINEDQHCRCSVCRNEYIPIKQNCIKQILRETAKKERDLPTPRNVAQWMNAHTYPNGEALKEHDGVLVIENSELQLCMLGFPEELTNSVRVIIFTKLALTINAKMFNDFYMLETVYFQDNCNIGFEGEIVGATSDLAMMGRIRVLGAKVKYENL